MFFVLLFFFFLGLGGGGGNERNTLFQMECLTHPSTTSYLYTPPHSPTQRQLDLKADPWLSLKPYACCHLVHMTPFIYPPEMLRVPLFTYDDALLPLVISSNSYYLHMICSLCSFIYPLGMLQVPLFTYDDALLSLVISPNSYYLHMICSLCSLYPLTMSPESYYFHMISLLCPMRLPMAHFLPPWG